MTEEKHEVSINPVTTKAELASRLRMHPRTLRRRLRQSGCNDDLFDNCGTRKHAKFFTQKEISIIMKRIGSQSENPKINQ